MNLKIQLIIAVMIVIMISLIVNMVRRKALELRYALAWFVLGCGVLILDVFPGLITSLSKLVGVFSPVNMLFFSGFVFSLGIIFVLTVAVSRMSIRVKELTQELALLEKHVEEEEKTTQK